MKLLAFGVTMFLLSVVTTAMFFRCLLVTDGDPMQPLVLFFVCFGLWAAAARVGWDIRTMDGEQ